VNLVFLARKGAVQYHERPAIICEGRTQTYGQLFQRSCQLANALARLGIKPGERVATLGDNSRESLEQVVGLALGGYVRCPLYTHNTGESNLYLLNLVEASVLLVQQNQLAEIAKHVVNARSLRCMIVFGGQESTPSHLNYEELLSDSSDADPHVIVHPDEPHIIRFSAGTTGKPKGIMHTLSGWIAIGTEMALAMPRMDENDRYLAAGPLSHAAILPVMGTLAAGGSIVVMAAFHPGQALELVERERCTTTLLVPTMIQMIVQLPEARTADLSSLRAVFYGAAPINERTLELAQATWGNIMYQFYGQSEVVPLTLLAPADHIVGGPGEGRRRLRSAGRPTANCQIRIVDTEGNDVPPGEVGEVAASSPTAMAGIWGDPEATAQRLLADGSVLTRDMGFIDEDGYLFLADRKEDLIISGGFNIWPAELENALASHPAVAEVAVIAGADDKWGETPKAVVVLQKGQAASEQELIEWTRQKLGSVKRVTSVDFVDSLPKTPLGKVLRRVVRDSYRERANPTQSASEP